MMKLIKVFYLFQKIIVFIGWNMLNCQLYIFPIFFQILVNFILEFPIAFGTPNFDSGVDVDSILNSNRIDIKYTTTSNIR